MDLVVRNEKIELFGIELLVNDKLCLENPDAEYKFNPALRLYIKITNACDANCDFCANKGCEDYGKLSLVKLKYVIEYLKENNYLSNISITSGESMNNLVLLERLIHLIWTTDPNIRIAISTNRYKLREFAYIRGMYIIDINTIVEFYAKMVKDCECNYTNQLVYTSDNKVIAGFGKKLVLK